MFSFARALSLGLVALPFAAAAIHDVQVGANGQLAFWPEAIVSALLALISIATHMEVISRRNREIKWFFTLIRRTTL
jgi:hypothetical protein